ncbi:dna alkylation repair protein : Putative DNA alkylation repair enzyme OS=Solitalea canadensis (strain ATCC 29591 / DSM 3403 / NBRC 15130 / NCIMB 12057 / USAM 9D) GN=Solca_1317 PE=4 SV=1: DNA_alkylation [Gemmata massiliana]|uniref:DNA alkylation repair protein n=1 Tax=Gemmata massiliana TaxID=1210884 RepID=A0A6P2D2K9_9BACT|nr:DNA alkylation repair protein [Gemmata massiliana]VTR94324.1 dna alkylation repair protein : Putative DNA alkylation repair enzyme OS=Solitalea canadensis (strain ATCC 29591 / DSM 3403 / NBRC 15130 / NCIMB 12057 / USAM 9D) GN=Solca_1317 PE=4 SV=1: DNA_alkylation [Gemmata massiliana]
MAKKAAGTPTKTKGAKPTQTVDGVLEQLKALGNEATRKQNAKWAYGGIQSGATQFGVKHGDIRMLAKTIGPDHALALSLWDTRNVDAQLLACLLMKPEMLSAADVDRLVRSITFAHVADWLHTNAIKEHPDKEALRQQWMTADNCWSARAGWGITSGRVAKSPEGLDLPALLDRIEAEMGSAAPAVQWTMNSTLAAIGINHPKLRKRAIAIGEKLGVYRDYPCSKGCTSPFAPIWINEMVKRQG